MSPFVVSGILYVATLYNPLSISQPIITLPSGLVAKLPSVGSLFTKPSRYLVNSVHVDSDKKLASDPTCQFISLSVALNIGDER